MNIFNSGLQKIISGSSDSTTGVVVILEPHQVNEVYCIQQYGFLIISTWTPVDQVLVWHIAALVNEPIVSFMEFWDSAVTSQFKCYTWSCSYAASTHLSEESVTIAATLLNLPELVIFLSSLSLVEIQLHLAEELGAAWLYNCSYNGFSLLDNDVWSHGAAAWASVT